MSNLNCDLFRDKKVLIAGGLGFIGSNLAKKLVDLGANVQILDSLVPESGGNLSHVSDIEHKIDIHIMDARNESEIKSLIKDKDYLFNLIGQTSHLDSMQDPYTDLEHNLHAQLSILEACRKINPRLKIIFTSTRQIYGKPQSLPVNEQHAPAPIDINGIHKLGAEWYHKIYDKLYGIRVCILRLTNTYGPRMRIKDSRQTFLGWWIHEILNSNELQIFGDGGQMRDFTFVDDAVEALLLAAERSEADHQIFNLGGENHICLEDLAKLLIQINGSGSYRFVAFPKALKAIDIGNYYADSSKIRSAIGWRPKTSLEEGLFKTLRFYRNNSQNDQMEQKLNAAL